MNQWPIDSLSQLVIIHFEIPTEGIINILNRIKRMLLHTLPWEFLSLTFHTHVVSGLGVNAVFTLWQTLQETPA